MNREGLLDDLRRLADLSDQLGRGILKLHDKILAAPEEQEPHDLDANAELSTRLRAELLCILRDAVEPTLRALRRLADEAAT